jgi:two-component system, chemotaxis family, protein-glutamate methylesterase/glutaminase
MRDIIVIGAPVGGGALVSRITCAFPPDLEASVFVALHMTPENPILLADILNAPGRIRAAEAAPGELIEQRRVYVACAGTNLILQNGRVHFAADEAQDEHRPSINALFISAANAFGKRVIGVLLLHAREDGLAGLYAVRRAGGRIITHRNEHMLQPPLHPERAEPLSDFHLEIQEIAPRVLACVAEEGNVAGQMHPDRSKRPNETPRAFS